MSFHQQLLKQTEADRLSLLSTPIIQGCLRGEVSLPSYVAFLREAYHHVRHTEPMMQTFRARQTTGREWLAPALA
ncbi:MAG: biliverdin-producing heme oxygenase, partial [Hydrogenophaga sp.]